MTFSSSNRQLLPDVKDLTLTQVTAENWIKIFNARLNKVFDTQVFFLIKTRTSKALCMPPATLNSALLFPAATERLRLHEIKAALRPWSRSPTGARGGRQRPQHPLRDKKEAPHPGNEGKH